MKFIANRMKNIQKSVIRQIFDSAPKDSYNLGLGEIQFPQDELLTNYAIQILQKEQPKYTPNAGLKELRESVADYYKEINFENICISVGAEEALSATFLSLFEKNDEILLADPTFLAYKTIIEMCDAKPVFFDLNEKDNFSPDFDSLKANISNKTKAIVLNNPSNPLSRKFSEEEMNSFVKIAKKNNLLLIVDEIYRELFVEEKPESFLKKYKNSLIISGVSKSHKMTGWRIGWIASKNKELIQKITTCHQYLVTCAPFLSQKIAVKALSEDGMKVVCKLREKLKSNLKYLIKKSEENSLEYLKPDSFPYFMIKVPEDDLEFCKKMAQNGVITIPGSAFGNNSKNWIRISYAIEKHRLEEAFEKFLDFMK